MSGSEIELLQTILRKCDPEIPWVRSCPRLPVSDAKSADQNS
jgi:hypothetical protein